MDFIKTLSKAKKGRIAEYGYAICSEKTLKVKVFSKDFDIETVGILENGIGCVLSKRKNPRATEHTMTTRNLSDGDIPANLMSAGYKFRIPAEKISDTEYVFMFDKASMVK